MRIDLYDIKKTNFIAAHETTLAAMTLNREGTRLATSSEKVNYDRVDVSLFCFVLSLSLSLIPLIMHVRAL